MYCLPCQHWPPGEAIAVSLGRLGISEISSFMVVTPLAIFAWHYFLGCLIDRYRKRKPSQNRA
jgi:hypothetical protein